MGRGVGGALLSLTASQTAAAAVDDQILIMIEQGATHNPTNDASSQRRSDRIMRQL